MLRPTKIEWADTTWNPVTGCLNNCGYCYARRIAHRFCANGDMCGNDIVELDSPYSKNGAIIPYPADFVPTLHRYRLQEPESLKKRKNIFVCSMGDLFGDWIPQDWINEVIEACRKAPQHNYLFLTKNPIRCSIWRTEKYPDIDLSFGGNMWLGCTFTGTERLRGKHITKPEDPYFSMSNGTNFWYLYSLSGNLCPTGHKFLSLEPLLCDVTEVEDERNGGKLLEHFIHPQRYAGDYEWVITGAETGTRKDKVVPKPEWVYKLIDLCRDAGIPLFLKDSLIPIIGEENMVRQMPAALSCHVGRRAS